MNQTVAVMPDIPDRQTEETKLLSFYYSIKTGCTAAGKYLARRDVINQRGHRALLAAVNHVVRRCNFCIANLVERPGIHIEYRQRRHECQEGRSNG